MKSVDINLDLRNIPTIDLLDINSYIDRNGTVLLKNVHVMSKLWSVGYVRMITNNNVIFDCIANNSSIGVRNMIIVYIVKETIVSSSQFYILIRGNTTTTEPSISYYLILLIAISVVIMVILVLRKRRHKSCSFP